jgi:hypothetical protein
LQRVAVLDPKPLKGEEEMAKAWADLEGTSRPDKGHEDSLAAARREAGCDGSGAPYVIRALFRDIETFGELSDRAALAATFLDEAHCPGAKGLSEKEKARLQQIRDQPPSRDSQKPAG